MLTLPWNAIDICGTLDRFRFRMWDCLGGWCPRLEANPESALKAWLLFKQRHFNHEHGARRLLAVSKLCVFSFLCVSLGKESGKPSLPLPFSKASIFCRDSMPKGGHRCVASSVSAQEFEISKHWLLNLVHLFPTIRGKMLFRARLTSWLLSLVPVLVGCMGYTADWKMILLDYMWLCLCHFWFCFNISPRFQVFFCGILWYGSWLFSCVSCILCSLFDPLNSRMPK